MKLKFTWSNEDFLLIAGSVTTLISINFKATDPLFGLTLGSFLKGAFSMLGINFSKTSDEDLMLVIGSFVTLAGINFDVHNSVFWVSIGAVLKGGFGLFGVQPASGMGAQAGAAALAAAMPVAQHAGIPAARQGQL